MQSGRTRSSRTDEWTWRNSCGIKRTPERNEGVPQLLALAQPLPWGMAYREQAAEIVPEIGFSKNRSAGPFECLSMRGNDETQVRLWYSMDLEDLIERDRPASCDQADSGRSATRDGRRFPYCVRASRRVHRLRQTVC